MALVLPQDLSSSHSSAAVKLDRLPADTGNIENKATFVFRRFLPRLVFDVRTGLGGGGGGGGNWRC